jgi:hypothetical protein
LGGIENVGAAVGFAVQAVPTGLIATASINCGFWFAALSFSYYTTLRIVSNFQTHTELIEREEKGKTS